MVSERKRRRLANGLERAVREAEAPRPLFSPAVPVDRVAVGDARGELLTLALELRSERPVRDEGVEQAHDLLTCGDSALYCSPTAEALRDTARRAREAL